MHDDAQHKGQMPPVSNLFQECSQGCRTLCLPCGATIRRRGNRYAAARFAALLIAQASSGLALARMERTLMPKRNAPKL